jgi:MutS domain V
MKVFLLHRDRDFELLPELRDPIYAAMLSGNPFAVTNARRNLEREREKNPNASEGPPTTAEVVTQDLELTTLWSAMAAGDEFLFETSRRGMLSSLSDPDAILYRQQVLVDCLEHPGVVRDLYALALEALENERKVGGLWSAAGPDRILSRSVKILKLHVEVLKRLRQLAEERGSEFASEGFVRFFAMVREELADDYIETVEGHLRDLEFKHGLLQSAALAKGVKGDRYVVRTQRELSWKERLVPGNRPPSYSFTIPPRDENGFRALEEIRGHGLNNVANAVAQSAQHVKSFFAMLRLELAFYLGCLNLHERLSEKGEPTCLPVPVPGDEPAFSCEGLYDVSLALYVDEQVVGNDVVADGKSLVLVTGANQGGKSTFLRSAGLAQLMMEAGMFVGARALRANVSSGLFTHFKREEDASMEGGKLDEELSRMSTIAGEIRPGALLLCNESFASTNEREGSEIARQVIRAMLDRQIKVFVVTHMYDLADGFYRQRLPHALFLRAERRSDGARTFRLLEHEPLPTSFGADSYRRIFGDPVTNAEAAASG